jgi:hypothetical protein
VKLLANSRLFAKYSFVTVMEIVSLSF